MLHPKLEEEVRRHLWAITSEAFDLMLKAIDEGKLESSAEPVFHGALEEIKSEMGQMQQLSMSPYHYGEKRGNVGLIRVEGPITPRASWITEASGITSADLIGKDLAAMEADPTIKEIGMIIDSPGGAVTGISELAAQIKACSKRVSSYIFGMAGSAAYWLASASDEIASSDTGIVGSIGTVMTIAKDGKNDARVKIVSSQSPRKNMEPDTDEGKAHYQELVDSLADVFIESVAINRDTTREDVLENYGKGGVMVANRAKKVGMIDNVSTFAEFMKNLGAPISACSGTKRPRGGKKIKSFDTAGEIGMQSGKEDTAINAEKPKPEGDTTMTLKEFLESNLEAKAEFDRAVIEASTRAEADLRNELKTTAMVAASDKYPAAVRSIAADVIAGSKQKETLDAVMAVAEMQAESRNSQAAIQASDKQGETGAQSIPQKSTDGKIRTTADFMAATGKEV
jgi:ClpP class serine protease